MALIQCHECQGKVSDHARTCPHCGAPVIATIKRRQKAALTDLAVRLVLAAILGIFVWVALHHLMSQAIAPLKAFEHPQQQTH